MKRAGNLWPSIIERGNLVRAFHQAARGKRRKLEVRRFERDLDANLERLRREIIDRSFQTGRFHVFKVFDPKERTIHAARFPERVFHHALMNLCEPVLERQSVFHSYACRKGKGRLKAIAAAQKAARKHAWHLKLDIRKYFESIPHERLIARLQRVFKDQEVLYWLERILRGHRADELESRSCKDDSLEFDHGLHGLGNSPNKSESGFNNFFLIRVNPCNPWFKNGFRDEGKGLPIGSLTSQHLANFYLGPLDRLCQRLPGVKAYARYMDDFVCWADDKASLLAAGREIRRFVEEELGLVLKHPPCPQRTARGMDFLGYRIFPGHAELNRRSKLRYRRKLGLLERLHEGCMISARALQERLTALTAFVLPARTHRFRRGVMEQIRSAAIGLEPGEPGRQLEQQRQQLPHREPQQQQPDQQQQQRGLPPCPQLRPRVPERTLSMGLNRPPSRSRRVMRRDKSTTRPPGAGSCGGCRRERPGRRMFPVAAVCDRRWISFLHVSPPSNQRRS